MDIDVNANMVAHNRLILHKWFRIFILQLFFFFQQILLFLNQKIAKKNSNVNLTYFSNSWKKITKILISQKFFKNKPRITTIQWIAFI